MKTKKILGLLLMIVATTIEAVIFVYCLFTDLDVFSVVVFVICFIVFCVGDDMSGPTKWIRK